METVDVQGARIPRLGFGTWQMVGRACRNAVLSALSAGYRHIDTAQMYDNEGDVGLALRDTDIPRDQLWITTKLGMDNLSAERVKPSTESSLKRLGTEYLDLLLIHWPSHDVPLAETMAALGEVREQGLARHIGVSNFPPSLFREALMLGPVLTNQVEYHPYLSQDAMLGQVRPVDVSLTAYSPLAKGRVCDDETLKRIGEKHGKSAAQVTLRWLLQQPKVVAIPKSSNPQRLAENLDVFDFVLDKEDMDAVAQLHRGERLIDPEWAPAWGS